MAAVLQSVLVIFQPAHGSVGVDGAAGGKDGLVKFCFGVMLRIAVAFLRMSCGQREHDGRHLLADIGKILRTVALGCFAGTGHGVELAGGKCFGGAEQFFDILGGTYRQILVV